MNDAQIPLPHLARELAALTGAEPPTYRKLYNLVLDGFIPTDFRNGRHYLQRDRLRDVAIQLRMIKS